MGIGAGLGRLTVVGEFAEMRLRTEVLSERAVDSREAVRQDQGMQIKEHDIRDGESSRDYVRRIPLWRRGLLLVLGVAAFTAAISYITLVFVTMRQAIEQLPLWLNFYLSFSFIFLALVTAAVMELRDRRQR